MNYIDQIKRQSVKVNDGSGILVNPMVGNHLSCSKNYNFYH